jgi:hypothetical protein
MRKTKSAETQAQAQSLDGSWTIQTPQKRWIDPTPSKPDPTDRTKAQGWTRLVQVNRSGSIPLYIPRGRSKPHSSHSFLSLTLRLSLLSLRLWPGRKLGRTAEDGGGRWRFRWIFIFSDDLMLLFQNLLYRNTRLPPLFTDLRLFSWNYDENGTDRTLNLRHLGFSNLFRSSWN